MRCVVSEWSLIYNLLIWIKVTVDQFTGVDDCAGDFQYKCYILIGVT